MAVVGKKVVAKKATVKKVSGQKDMYMIYYKGGTRRMLEDAFSTESAACMAIRQMSYGNALDNREKKRVEVQKGLLEAVIKKVACRPLTKGSTTYVPVKGKNAYE